MDNNISKSNIHIYITDLLLKSENYIKFKSIKVKQHFINYIWKSYNDYNKFVKTTKIREKLLYKEKYAAFDNDLFDEAFKNNELLEWCLFIDASEYAFKYDLPSIIFFDKNDSKTHWLLRIGNSNNFKNSSKFNIWGVQQTTSVKNFESLVQEGDILWFIVSKNNGQAVAFAEYVNHNERTKTDEELGWKIENNSNNWTIEINYKNLTNVENKNYFTHIIGQNVNIRQYNNKCNINLPQIYEINKNI
jgi:hypothetical protein